MGLLWLVYYFRSFSCLFRWSLIFGTLVIRSRVTWQMPIWMHLWCLQEDLSECEHHHFMGCSLWLKKKKKQEKMNWVHIFIFVCFLWMLSHFQQQCFWCHYGLYCKTMSRRKPKPKPNPQNSLLKLLLSDIPPSQEKNNWQWFFSKTFYTFLD